MLRETNGTWEIVAVTSFIQESLDGSGDGILGNYGDLTGFADVPLYTDWINKTVLETSGDFNGDGAWDGQDIDSLVGEIVAMTHDVGFDMTGDGLVDEEDLHAWLVEGGAMNPDQTGGNPFLTGDANLDGVVDGLDFIAWNGSKFTGETDWTKGNFFPDTVVDGLDFIAWNGNKFTSSDTLSPVPEPGSAVTVITLFGLIATAYRRRRTQL